MEELTVAQASEASGYSKRHIARLAESGAVGSRRIGERVLLIDADSLTRYAEDMKALGTSKHTRQR